MGNACCPKHTEIVDVVVQNANAIDGFGPGPDPPLDLPDFVTSKEFVEAMAKGERKVSVAAIVHIVRHSSDDAEGNKAGGPPKSAGFVTRDEVRRSDWQPKVVFSQEGVPPELNAAPTGGSSRVQDWKGTGYVTKEKLLSILADDSDEENGALSTPSAQAPADLDARKCSNRKGTGFVTKAKLQKVLDAVGDGQD